MKFSPKVCITLQWKSQLGIPRKGIAPLRPQFSHSCVCERFIFYIPRIGPPIFPQQNRQTDRGNKYIAHRNMNVEIGTETAQLHFLGIAFRFHVRYCVFVLSLYISMQLIPQSFFQRNDEFLEMFSGKLQFKNIRIKMLHTVTYRLKRINGRH